MVKVLPNLDSTVRHIKSEDGKPTKDFYNWMKSITDGVSIATTMQRKIIVGDTMLKPEGATNFYSFVGGPCTVTIPSNATRPCPLGTEIVFANFSGVSNFIAIDSDNLILVPGLTNGTHTIADSGLATATKVKDDTWAISGFGLS